MTSELIQFLEPARFAADRLHFHPDPHQARVLDPAIRRGILNCTRQWGKSTVTAIRAVHHAFFNPNSLTIVLAPTERQSAELVRKCRQLLTTLDLKAKGDGTNKTSLVLPNGARIVGLPGNQDNIRGFSAVSLLLIDEAARVPDDLYHSVRPMVATTGDHAAVWLMSTPKGKRGFFYEEFINPESPFTKITVPATECPRISESFLAEEKRTLPEHMFAQEYLCQFSQSSASLFREDDIDASLRDDMPPMFPGDPMIHVTVPQYNFLFPHPYQSFFLGLDLGQSRDFTALAILELLTVFTDQIDRVTYERKTKQYYRLRHLDRIPLHTDYETIVDYICRLLARQDLAERTSLVVDATGVGAPVLEMLRKRRPPAREILGVAITAGDQAKRLRHEMWTVPRRDLLYSVEYLLRNRLLQVAAGAPHTRTFTRELALMERDFTPSGRETFEQSTATAHDDLLFATALACWRARSQDVPTAIPPDAFRFLTNPIIPGLR